MSGILFSNVNEIQFIIPENQNSILTRWCSTGRHFTAATQSLDISCCNINNSDKIPQKEKYARRKQKPRFYWRCSSMVMKNAKPLTPLAHMRKSRFKCKRHAIHDQSQNYNTNNVVLKWHFVFISIVENVRTSYLLQYTVCFCFVMLNTLMKWNIYYIFPTFHLGRCDITSIFLLLSNT